MADLPDSGAAHFAETIRLVKAERPDLLVECLTGDFAGQLDCVEKVARAGLDVYAHNVETVEEVREREGRANQGVSCLFGSTLRVSIMAYVGQLWHVGKDIVAVYLNIGL